LVVDLDLEEDGPPVPATYVPSAHEVPPEAVPIPPLPDPSTLPSDPLIKVGEIINVLPDTVIIRGGLAVTASERKDAALDEGSLLLFSDRTPLGYVFETFGPTSLPHYVVRIDGKAIAEAQEASENPVKEEETTNQPNPAPYTSSQSYIPSQTLISVSQSVYHIPSLSNFVFTSALARMKGSDASNIHDEEPAEHELEFSDDEAEAAYKRQLRYVFKIQ